METDAARFEAEIARHSQFGHNRLDPFQQGGEVKVAVAPLVVGGAALLSGVTVTDIGIALGGLTIGGVIAYGVTQQDEAATPNLNNNPMDGLQRSAPDTPGATLEGFPGERLPPPPPLITPAQESKPQITSTPIPEQATPEAIGGGYSAPELDTTLPGFTPVTPPVDTTILENSPGKLVEIVDATGNPLGEFDEIVDGAFIEDKSAAGLSVINQATGQPYQTAQSWAVTHIYDKTAIRIANLEKASETRPKIGGSDNVPSLDEIKDIREIKFRVESTESSVKVAVESQIKRLTQDFPEWKFSAEFGNK